MMLQHSEFIVSMKYKKSPLFRGFILAVGFGLWSIRNSKCFGFLVGKEVACHEASVIGNALRNSRGAVAVPAKVSPRSCGKTFSPTRSGHRDPE